MSQRRPYLAAAIVISFVGLWVACQPANDPGPLALRVGSHTTILSAALDIAAGKGYFLQEGLRVSLDHQESSKVTMPALISGSLVIAIGSNSAGSLNHLATGKIQILADAARVVPRLLVRRKLLESGGVSLIPDLRNRSIRVPREGSASHFALHKILAAAAVPDEAVTLSFLDEQLTLAELDRGGLDAAILNEPYASEAIERGIAGEPWAPQISKLFGDHGQQHMVLFVNKAYADSHRSAIDRFLKAYRTGIRDYLRAREAPRKYPEILEIIARYTGASTELVTKAEWPWISPDAQPDMNDLHASQDYFLRIGLVDEPVSLALWSPSPR